MQKLSWRHLARPGPVLLLLVLLCALLILACLAVILHRPAFEMLETNVSAGEPR